MKAVVLPKNFFKNNELDDMSAPMFAYANANMRFDESLSEKTDDLVRGFISDERIKKIDEEREKISAMEKTEDFIRFFRSGYDIANRGILCKRALMFQKEVMPLLLERYRTNMMDTFIETAFCVFSKCEPQYIDSLFEMYRDIRNPYAQCLACLAFGVHSKEEALPLLLSEYERLKSVYPDQSFAQGPLLAIHVLFDNSPLTERN